MEANEAAQYIRELSVSQAFHKLHVYYRNHASSEDLNPQEARHLSFLALRCKTLYEALTDNNGNDQLGGRANVIDLLRGFVILGAFHPNEGGAKLYTEVYEDLCTVLSELVGREVRVDAELVEHESIRRTQTIWIEMMVLASKALKNRASAGPVVVRGNEILLGSEEMAKIQITNAIVTQSLGELAVFVDSIGKRIETGGLVQ